MRSISTNNTVHINAEKNKIHHATVDETADSKKTAYLSTYIIPNSEVY